MTEPAPEPTVTLLLATEALQEALVQFTANMAAAVDDVCSWGIVIGETYVPFDMDEDEECGDDDPGVQCAQGWVRLQIVQPKPGGQSSFEGTDCYMELTYDIEVGVLRCFNIPERGEAPRTTDMLVASMEATNDMNLILNAALSDPIWGAIDVGQWIPLGPLGGQHGGIWSFTVETK